MVAYLALASWVGEDWDQGVRPDCVHNGCLKSITLWGDYRREEIANEIGIGTEVENGYSVYQVSFASDGRTARATITVPFGLAPPPLGWHVVALAPWTVGTGDVCAPGNSLYGVDLAGSMGARGMVGVAVDYAGLGTEGNHPYLVSEVEGRSILDALRAMENLGRIFEIPLSGKSAVVGVSQGGHAVIGTAAQHEGYAPELAIRAFGAAAPSHLSLEGWGAYVDVPGTHLAYYAWLVHSWLDHYGNEGPPVWAPGMEARIDSLAASKCQGGNDSFVRGIGKDPSAIFSDTLIHDWQEGDLSAWPALEKGFVENDIQTYHQTAPLLIYQGGLDSIVPAPSTNSLVSKLREGGVEVDYRVVGLGRHTDVAFGPLSSRQWRREESLVWLRQLLDGE
ncbi:hypothetical protein H8D30_04860 [bacterium]|nr:hypothetical protein [bacterium]